MKQRPEITERKARTILLKRGGLDGKKNPATGKLFFLDSFYRTNQALTDSLPLRRSEVALRGRHAMI